MLGQREVLMNSFYEHHKDSIRWHYRCFDRILLNGLIQPFQQPERVVGFFNTYRQLYPVTRYTLRDIAEQFQRWVKERAANRNIPIVEAPKGRRDEFVDPYFERAKPDAVVVILKAREPARIMIAIGDKVANRWHLQIANRWVVQYNFYINDRNWGRMFVRICPYLPFSARMRRSQQAFSAPSKQTQSSNAKDEPSSTGSINALSTTSISSSELLASKPRDCTLKREQNSCYKHDNGPEALSPIPPGD